MKKKRNNVVRLNKKKKPQKKRRKIKVSDLNRRLIQAYFLIDIEHSWGWSQQASEVYSDYLSWCSSESQTPCSVSVFQQEACLYVNKKQESSGRVFYSIKPEFLREVSETIEGGEVVRKAA